jgi:hypothetical protein
MLFLNTNFSSRVVIAYVNFPMGGEFWPLQEIPLFNQYTHLAKD